MCPLAPADSKADKTLNIAWEEVRATFRLGGLGPPSSQVSRLEASRELGEGRRFASFSEVPKLSAGLGRRAVKDWREERVGESLGGRFP